VPLSWNLGTLTSWNPLGHSRPVMELLYFFLIHRKYSFTSTWIGTGCFFHHAWNHLFNFIVPWIFYKQNCLWCVFHFCTITKRKVLLNTAKYDERRQRDAITKCFSFIKIWEIVFFAKPPSWQSWFFKKKKILQYRLGAVLPNVVMRWLTSKIYGHNSFVYAN